MTATPDPRDLATRLAGHGRPETAGDTAIVAERRARRERRRYRRPRVHPDGCQCCSTPPTPAAPPDLAALAAHINRGRLG